MSGRIDTHHAANEGWNARLRAVATFRALASSSGHASEDSATLATFIAGSQIDDERAHLYALAAIGVEQVVDEIKQVGFAYPREVAEAVDAPSAACPKAAAWSAVLAWLDDADMRGARAALAALDDLALADALGYLARLYASLHRRRFGPQRRLSAVETWRGSDGAR